MGFEKETNSNLLYFVIKDGVICQESKKMREGFESVTRTNPETKEQVTKYVMKYKALDGLICDIVWYDTKDKYKTRFMGFKVFIDGDGVGGVLDLPLDSIPCKRFMKTAPNIDFSKPVRLSAWPAVKGDRKTTAFSIQQGGEKVEQYYTIENPLDCPEPIKSRTTEKWDYTLQEDFLVGKMMDDIIPELRALGHKMPGGVQTVKAGGFEADHSEEPEHLRDHLSGDREPELSDDDIPF